MRKYKWGVYKTLEFVKDKRKIAAPNKGFIKQLHSYSDKLTSAEEEEVKQELKEKPKPEKLSTNEDEEEKISVQEKSIKAVNKQSDLKMDLEKLKK